MDEDKYSIPWEPIEGDPVADIIALKEYMLAQHRDYLERRARGYILGGVFGAALVLRVPTWEQIAEIEAREP